MDPIVYLFSGVLGALGTGYAGWQVRKKVGSEAEKNLADRDSIIVQSATSAVALSNSQMQAMNKQMTTMTSEMSQLRGVVRDYKDQLEKITKIESNLRAELTKLRRRVTTLETFITDQGLPVPNGTHRNTN